MLADAIKKEEEDWLLPLGLCAAYLEILANNFSVGASVDYNR